MTSADVESYLSRLAPNPAMAELFRRYGTRYRWYAVSTIVTANIAAILASTIINVAIPQIMGAFGIGQDDAQWLSTANLASSTVAMLSSAWLVKTAGLQRTVNIAMGLFLVGCVVGGFARNTDIMIISRIMQGLSAGLLTPLSMTIIFQVFPAGTQGLAMGITSVGVILVPAVGPAVGGFLVDTFNWRYVFFLGVPFSLLTLIGAAYFLPGRQESRRIPFDWTGMALLSIAITCLLVGLSRGERDGWNSDFIIGCFMCAAGFGAIFIRRELRIEDPLLDLSLFGNRNFAILAAIGFVFGAGLYASTYLLPLFLQLVQHLTPTDSGILMIPAGLVMLIIFPVAGRLADRADHRVLITFGIAFFSTSFWLMSEADSNTAFLTFAWWIVLSRVGIGLVMPALQMGALSQVNPAQITQASGSFNFVRQLGGAFGVNLMSVALERRTSFHGDYLMTTQTFANTDTMQLLGGLRALSQALGFAGTDQWRAAIAFLHQIIGQEALVAGFKDSFVILTLAFLATLIPTWLLASTRGRSIRPKSARTGTLRSS